MLNSADEKKLPVIVYDLILIYEDIAVTGVFFIYAYFSETLESRKKQW